MNKVREKGPLDKEFRWLYFLKNGHEMTVAEVKALGEKTLCAAEERLRMISQDRSL